MPVHDLYNRWSKRPFAVVKAESRARAVELAARSGIDLSYADLSWLFAPGCFLPGVDLRGVDLTAAELSGGYLRKADLRSAMLVKANLGAARIREADLRHADLRKADLGDADLRDADLRWADLRRARFVGADLRGVQLNGARMQGTVIDWRWSGFAVELLRRDDGCRGDALRLVVELAFENEDRPFGWIRSLVRKTESLEWALGVLGRAIVPSDNAPELLRRLTADAVVDSVAPPASQLLWTRRADPPEQRRTPRLASPCHYYYLYHFFIRT